ncbi:MAG: hypothetical protein IK089_04245 [Oxalobacter sp.]|nr:hypothetical protein [Oxalobacter sp.]
MGQSFLLCMGVDRDGAWVRDFRLACCGFLGAVQGHGRSDEGQGNHPLNPKAPAAKTQEANTKNDSLLPGTEPRLWDVGKRFSLRYTIRCRFLPGQ